MKDFSENDYIRVGDQYGWITSIISLAPEELYVIVCLDYPTSLVGQLAIFPYTFCEHTIPF